ncbi:hypothetical protein [Methylocaldum sp. SAD2]|jgi:YD repeat-containing protein|uniref:hypothetical protein n=1 Tax=Methylocaldum sp. GT1BB TaxID=3438963 RepID=UPI000A31F640
MLRYAALTALPNGKYNPPPVRHAADQDGNLTGDGVWSYAYDLDHRLTSASKTGLSATLAYDGEGRLRQTTIGGVTTHLLYDGADLLAEYDSTGNLLRRYVHAPGINESNVATGLNCYVSVQKRSRIQWYYLSTKSLSQ